MMFIPKIQPGEQISAATVNALIDTANRRIRSAVTSSVSDSRAGVGIVPARFAEPIYGVLSAFSTDPTKDHHYEFREVVLDVDGHWVAKPGGMESKADAEFAATILDPAVELNGNGGLDLNTIVRLVPGEYKSDQHGRVDREWFFSTTTQVKAFELTADLIPTGGGEFDTTIQAYFLRDQTREPVTLYPPQLSGFERGGFFSLGIGRRAGYYNAGTHGWAQWVDDARLEFVDGEIVSIGEWQIITLYAALIAEVRIYNAPLLAGETGPAQLWWEDWDDEEQATGDENFALINSTYQLQVTNSLGATLVVGEKLKVEFNRDDYRWYPVSVTDREFFGKVQTGFVNADGDTLHNVDLKACEWDGAGVVGAVFQATTPIKANRDTNLFVGDIVTYRVMSDGTKVIRNDVWEQPIGTVVWEALNTANIRNDRGWHLADGTNGTQDLSGRFIMCIDEGGFAGAGAYGGEDTIGDTGGFRAHGTGADGAANAHGLHDNHGHAMHTTGSQQVDANIDGVTINVVGFDAAGPLITPWTAGFDKLPAGGAGAADDFDGHHGPFNVAGRLGDTDNRGKYFVLAARQYTGVV